MDVSYAVYSLEFTNHKDATLLSSIFQTIGRCNVTIQPERGYTASCAQGTLSASNVKKYSMKINSVSEIDRVDWWCTLEKISAKKYDLRLKCKLLSCFIYVLSLLTTELFFGKNPLFEWVSFGKYFVHFVILKLH